MGFKNFEKYSFYFDNKYSLFYCSNSLICLIPVRFEEPFHFIYKIDGFEKIFKFYLDESSIILKKILYEIKSPEQIDELVDIASFNENKNFYNYTVSDSFSINNYLYSNVNGINKIFRHYEYSKSLGRDDLLISYIDLNFVNSGKPIQKRFLGTKEIETYYYFDNSNLKLELSFNLLSDLPFQIIRRFDSFNNNIVEKEYSIPNVKNNRTLIYKPSFEIFKNGKIDYFEYIVGGVDYTYKINEYLSSKNIDDPSNHDFSNDEILEIKFLLNII